jgi:hypothetical protein
LNVDFVITEMNNNNHHDLAKEILKNVWLEKTNSSNAWEVATLAWWTSRTV